MKESSPCKESSNQSPRDKGESSSPKERRQEEPDHEHRTEPPILLKPILPAKDTFSNPGSPEFDSSFYSSVSCNIRENLLHHLDGKLQSTSSATIATTTGSSSVVDTKPQQQQSFYEHNVSQIQFPIDISLTAATPVYSKEYTNEEYENSSEYAQKPGKSNRSHPRRVSFEKYNFPRKYDGKEQWTCSIKDLSKFDISTQLSLRKKQQLLKERITLNRLHQIPILAASGTTDISRDEQNLVARKSEDPENLEETLTARNNNTEVDRTTATRRDVTKSNEREVDETKNSQATEFTLEFGSFLRLRKWDEKTSNEAAKKQEVVYAELSGEWSRPRVYICGACATKHVTLKEMEDHKASMHPNVWCSHFEFSGDQRELYKHLFLPGKDVPTAKAKAAILVEKVCTKCTRNCNTLPELHRHMLECGGDQAWLLGLFGNGKKKCKWRPFGSRSRRRRQRGMKRNIQNSQTPRVNTPKEKQPTGPRVRPSDRESIQKMLANLPPKRATRKVMQDSALRTQGRLRNVQTRSRPGRMVGDISTASRMSRNKAVLRNKLLKNAKSIQRNRCRIDNISAVIESVVKNYNAEDTRSDAEKRDSEKFDVEKDAKEKKLENARAEQDDSDEKGNKTRIQRGGPRVLSKKRNVKPKEGAIRNVDQPKKSGYWKAKAKAMRNLEVKVDSIETPRTPKSVKLQPKGNDKETEATGSTISPVESKSPSLSTKSKLSLQTTPKKKRPVDPVASLNASIKAKSQLRTHDGKFARNPNKATSPQKSPEIRSPIGHRQSLKGKGIEQESSITRSKLRTVPRGRHGDQLSKRTTRLSSDSDKMPTLEPAVQLTAEEYIEASTNDLPILSPATPASSSEKILRGKNLFPKSSDEVSKKGIESEEIETKNIGSDLSEEDKDQKLGKTRRAKSDAKHLEKSLENIVAKVDAFKERTKGVKEKFKRKSAPGRIANDEKKVSTGKTSEESSPKKEPKQKKEEGTTKTLETRSNSKAKLVKCLDADSRIMIQNVPFEVKKLIGSDNKDDLLTTLVLTSRAAASKRCLRQPVPKTKTDQDVATASTRKEKVDLRRKSSRNTDKRLEKVSKEDKLATEESNKTRGTNETKIRGRRSSSSSGENKSTYDADQASSSEGLHSKMAVEFAEQIAENENTSNKRQTRGFSLNTNEVDTHGKETSSESNDMSLKKNTSLGKRRGRIKSSNDLSEKKYAADVSRRRSEEVDKNNSTEILDKTTEETSSVRKRVTVQEDDNIADDGKEEENNLVKVDQLDSNETGNANPNLNHLQLETSNSIDSGKENSLETIVGVQKLKVGRPRKSWGARRERTSKRSLNNVIGILTEGMNIPVESQQSVVLTVQTTLDNASPEGILQSNAQQSDDGGSRSLSLERTDRTETANDPDRVVDETGPCVQNTEEKSQEPQTTEVSVKETNVEDSLTKCQKVDGSTNDARRRSPTNDIILDLSRRKQKGKGSFLEKIVSKIAKQKDALLEGEVGSLLDTAADELTSILDEVGPGLSEATENSVEARNAIGKSKLARKARGNREEIEEKSSDENCHESSLLIGTDPDQNAEPKEPKIDETRASKSDEEVVSVPRIEEQLKETIDDTGRIDEEETKDESTDPPDTEVVDRLVKIESLDKDGSDPSKVQEKACHDDVEIHEQVSTETDVPSIDDSLPNEVSLPISASIVESVPNSEQSLEQTEKSAKQDREGTMEETKVKRKSKKRSLEGNSPKKNKRKSIEPDDSADENLVPEVLHLADIMKLIDRSKEVPSAKENDSSPETVIEHTRPGKRKTLNDEADKDSTNVEANDDAQTSVDDGTKKLKTDAENNAEENRETENEENESTNPRNENIEDTPRFVDEVRSSSEEKDSPRVTGKRKPVLEAAKQCSEIESPVRRSSKRKSLPDEKLNQLSEEETSSKIESAANGATSETTRRRSSRTRSSVQPKYEEKSHKAIEGDFDTDNAVVADNTKLPLNHSPEDCQPSKCDASIFQPTILLATEDLNRAGGDTTGGNDPENQKTNEESTAENIPQTDSKESQKSLDTPPIVKIPKKRGRKKKCLTNDPPRENPDTKSGTQTTVIESIVAFDHTPSRKSLRTSRSNKEIDQTKHTSDLVDSQSTPSGLEHFKIPEVTEVLQHTKKRTFKKKSTTEEHSDVVSVQSLESETNVECPEARKTIVEKDERMEHACQKDSSEGRRRSSRNSNRDQLELERSSSSGSIDLAQSSRTRSSRKKQLSSEDLPGQEALNHRAESVDSLSETSCVSESSYFRKKRFSKRKKGFEERQEDAHTDTSVTDSESVEVEKNRRQSLKRRAKKNISFFEYQFDLVDDFDIPMDIQDCLQREDTAKNVDPEPKSTTVVDKSNDTGTVQEIANVEVEEDTRKEEVTEESTIEEKVTLENATEENATEENAMEENATEENATEENATEENATEENATEENATEENVIEENVIDENVIDKNAIEENVMEKNAIEENVIEKDAIEENAIEKDVIEENVIEKDAIEENVIEKDVTEETVIEENATEENAMEETETKENESIEDHEKSIEEDDEEAKERERADAKLEGGAQMQEDFQTPKKRAAGNFVVVHKKTGEILIVEKRKKLTKEAARFFCDVCATSFTRKSSLKKHNLSQSHLIQMAKSRKEKTLDDSTEEGCNVAWENETSGQNETSSDENKSPDQSASVSRGSKDDQKDDDLILDNSSDLKTVQSDTCYATSMEQGFLIDSHVTRQRSLEDELLDEEICKITENMSHDEYVLTEHSSPAPESTSTPIKAVIKKTGEPTKKKKHEKRKEKGKKKHAVNEQLALDTPDPETPLDTSRLTVLGTSMSIRISRASCSNASETPLTATVALERLDGNSLLADSSNNSEPRTNPFVDTDDFQDKYPDGTDAPETREDDQDLSTKMENATSRSRASKRPELEQNRCEDADCSGNELYELKGDLDDKTDEFSSTVPNDRALAPTKENQPQERLSLKFVIHKRNIERTKESTDIIENDGELEDIDREPVNKFENVDSVNDSIEELNRCKSRNDYVDEDSSSDLSKGLEKETKRNAELVDDSNVSTKEAQQVDRSSVENLQVDTKTVCSVLDDRYDEETPVVIVEGKTEDATSPRNESTRTTRHGKSKKGKTRKRVEEVESPLSARKTSKFKGNQNRQVPEEVAKLTENHRVSTDCSETFESTIFDQVETERANFLSNSRFEHRSNDINDSIGLEKPEDEAEYEFNGLEIVDDQQTFYSGLKSRGETSSERTTETMQSKLGVNNNEGFDDDEIESFHPLEEDEEASSSSSLADKPLSQVLLKTDEHLQAEKEQEKERSVLNFLKDREESQQKENLTIEDTGSKGTRFDVGENSVDIVESMDGQKEKRLINSEQSESRIGSEEDCEPETLKVAEDSDREATISLEYRKIETVAKVKVTADDKETKQIISVRKSSINDRQSLSKRTSKSHRYVGRDSHRRSKSKKASVRSKIADLSSESDVSENEDKIESQNKSKIVKSVFGRVFGGEKAEKVKEVLNDWVSKSEEDSDASRTEPRSGSTDEQRTKDVTDAKNEERNTKRHSISSTIPSSPKKRSGKKSRKSSSSDRARERRASVHDSQEEHRSGKHTKSKNSSHTRKKNDTEAANYYFLVLPPTSCRPSKKRAEERISKAFEDELSESNVTKGQRLSKQKEANYELRNQGKSDLSIKDSGYGSFNYDEDTLKLVSSEELTEEDQKLTKRRKPSAFRKVKSKHEDEDDDWRNLVVENRNEKNAKESDEENCSAKDDHEEIAVANRLSVDLESSRSCSSAIVDSVRNRSPSLDRCSQTTGDSDIEDEGDREKREMERRKISPFFICGTPRSSIDSSSDSENEDEDENLTVNETVARKRSSSEFSGEKIVIRSPSSTHKTEMVTIAPTDAIEDNALDVPQEIETTKPRQGKVLNFDEELFVECCSRLKATTENELRGAKKIKLDHNEGYHRKDEQQQGFRGPRDRWRDVESQNSLGSLLESVNQLLGEEMYSTRERDYPKRGGRNLRSEQSSRSASPDMSRADNLGYEDSLDVAFEHNNKLRDKIQQRMRESESLIANTFGQKSSNEMMIGDERPSKNNEQEILRNTYNHLQDQGPLSGGNLSNGGYNDDVHLKNVQGQQSTGKMSLDSPGFKSKMNSALGGLLDKALSNLLHSNGKHDHNGSTPMKVLAELACARAPTSTASDPTSQPDVQAAKTSSPDKDSVQEPSPLIVPKEQQKKIRNPIKELFEKKKEMNERKQQEKSKTEAALRELNVHRQRKTKKSKKHQDFPLIRRSEHGGLVERKKRRDGFERKEEFVSDRIKDVYDFDEEESQMEPNLGSVMSYRSRPGYEVSCLRTKEVDVAGLMSKAIGDSLENGKTGDALSTRLESMIDRKFKELEKFAPKTKGALKSFQSEEQQGQVTGPMDDFVERKQSRLKRPVEQNIKHSKLKKRSKNSKKRPRNAWYENDSSDEYRTAVKTEGVGVGISKSQRTCSKGKQNIFAELYTSSESEFDDEDVDYEAKRQRKAKKCAKKVTELENVKQNQELITKYCSENDDRVDEWEDQDLKNDVNKNDCDNKKSESEMSDQPLVIDERKDLDEQRNSDDETENQYEGNFALDDLYREDSSVAESDLEEPTVTESQTVLNECKADNTSLPQEKIDCKTDYMQDDELIPLEEALNLLDQADTDLGMKYDDVNKDAKPVEDIETVAPTEFTNKTFDPVEESTEKCPSPVEEQEEEEPDDDILTLPEKLSTNEKPQKESDNLPLHVFLSRKVQESKKRKEQQLRKMQEEQERILMDFQPTRRQRKCAIGKQGLLAEISSSDEETSPRDSRKTNEKLDHEKPRKQKRESKEKRKERYIEKKHEQMIAKEQKAIEEEILRELGKKKESLAQNSVDAQIEFNGTEVPESAELPDDKTVQEQAQKRKHQTKEKQKKLNKVEEDVCVKKNNDGLNDLENDCNKSAAHLESNHENENNQESSGKQKKHSKSPTKPKKNPKGDAKVSTTSKKSKNPTADKFKNRTDSKGSKDKERRSSSGKRDSDDEELKTTKSWNKVEEGVGVAIGRRKRAAANQLYYWSSSSDEEEMLEVVPAVEEEEDDRQEQHGWIVGDSHKRMITMLAMEKQLKEKRRRSEDEFEPGKAKSKKHRNSTS
ncbi:uncharacterized protein LOC143153434 isoform X3 [Ptiloglossa arizonensis]